MDHMMVVLWANSMVDCWVALMGQNSVVEKAGLKVYQRVGLKEFPWVGY